MNAYGLLTERWNPNPTRFVARAATVCGLETRARLPSCSNLRDVLGAANKTAQPFGPPGSSGGALSSFHAAVETGFHSILHAAVGGAWDCRMADGTSISARDFVAQYPQARRVVETVASYTQLLWRAEFDDDTACGGMDTCPFSVRCPPAGSCAGGAANTPASAARAARPTSWRGTRARGDAAAEVRLAEEVLPPGCTRPAGQAVGQRLARRRAARPAPTERAPATACSSSTTTAGCSTPRRTPRRLPRAPLHPRAAASASTRRRAERPGVRSATDLERLWHYAQVHPEPRTCRAPRRRRRSRRRITCTRCCATAPGLLERDAPVLRLWRRVRRGAGRSTTTPTASSSRCSTPSRPPAARHADFAGSTATAVSTAGPPRAGLSACGRVRGIQPDRGLCHPCS